MSKVTNEIAKFITDVQLCFVATVNEDGSPNLSPKGSLAAYENDTVLFANIASPATVENIKRNPAIEINVVDIFLRRGYRFRGTAEIMPEGTDEYSFVAEPMWKKNGDGYPVFNVVKVNVAKLEEVLSPAYTFGEGVTEESLRDDFAKKYADQIPSTNA